ncbi:hypothetical protein ACJ41O_011704 [Fusarium nematophilum]
MRRRLFDLGLVAFLSWLLVVIYCSPKILSLDWIEGSVVEEVFYYFYPEPEETIDDHVKTGIVEDPLPPHLQHYVNAIFSPQTANSSRLDCPGVNVSRYGPLKTVNSASPKADFLFALMPHNCRDQLPTLIGAVVDAIRFLGPSRCTVSVADSSSWDGTREVLEVLRRDFEDLGVAAYFFEPLHIDWTRNRDKSLAVQVRNLTASPYEVSLCAEDILELVFQQRMLGADMACGLGWPYSPRENVTAFPNFGAYRGMNGAKFGRFQAQEMTEESIVLESPKDQARLDEKRPFQVYSCWGGAVAFRASHLVDGEVYFRRARPKQGGCKLSDTTLFCKDMWFRGHGRVAVIPSVNLLDVYKEGYNVKRVRGYASELVREQDLEGDQISWVEKPPREVDCGNPITPQWQAWNASLP